MSDQLVPLSSGLVSCVIIPVTTACTVSWLYPHPLLYVLDTNYSCDSSDHYISHLPSLLLSPVLTSLLTCPCPCPHLLLPCSHIPMLSPTLTLTHPCSHLLSMSVYVLTFPHSHSNPHLPFSYLPFPSPLPSCLHTPQRHHVTMVKEQGISLDLDQQEK